MTEERVLIALHAGPDLVSLSVSIGDDDAELGDLVADDSAEVPFEMAALVARPRRPPGPPRLPQPPRAGDPLAALRARGRPAPHARRGGPPLQRHPRADPPDRGQGAHQAAPPVLGPAPAPRVLPRELAQSTDGVTARRARAISAPLVSNCRSGRSSLGNQPISTISGDAGAGRVWVDARRRARARKMTSTRCAGASTTTAGSPTSSTSRVDLLAHLAAGGVGGRLAPLEQAARKSPAVPIRQADEQHGTVRPLDHADGADRVGGCDRPHHPSTGPHREASEHHERELVDTAEHAAQA